jgi:hypothetical protein
LKIKFLFLSSQSNIMYILSRDYLIYFNYDIKTNITSYRYKFNDTKFFSINNIKKFQSKNMFRTRTNFGEQYIIRVNRKHL